MIVVFYIFAALLVYLSWRSLRGGIDYLNYFKNELAKPPSGYAPFATVFAPCKGLDDGLEKNLAALLEQEYPRYEVIFVVDDENDPARKVIDGLLNRSIMSSKLCGAEIVTAQLSLESSQKVENLRETVLHANEDSEVFVFVDSDARPSKDWISNLIAPLKDETVGAATGYRWFISPTPTFASEMLSVWNASIASALGPDQNNNFCWGGSMAIRRSTFEKLEIRERWRGTLSDDFVVTRTVRKAGLSIYFVPKALTASVSQITFGELLEFTTRQMKITRVYGTKFWLMSFFGSAVFIGVMVTAILILIFSSTNGLPVWVAMITLASVVISGTAKALYRLAAAKLALTRHEQQLEAQRFTQATLWLVAPALFFYNSVAAWLSRRMIWRGIEYLLVSPTETKVIHRSHRSPARTGSENDTI